MPILASEGCFWPPTASMTSEVKNTVPTLSRKTFATNSLTETFVWEVCFHGQIVYSNIEHPLIINKIEMNKHQNVLYLLYYSMLSLGILTSNANHGF